MPMLVNEEPFTAEDIINKLSVYLDDNAQYLPNVGREAEYARKILLVKTFDEQRTAQFNEVNFGTGRCNFAFRINFASPPEDLHLQRMPRLGPGVGNIVFFNALKAVFNGDEEIATSKMKAAMTMLEREAGCSDVLARFNEFINTVIQAAPTVLAEKKKQALAKQQVAQKVVDEDRAKTLAWMAQQQKLEACQSNSPYKLYQISINIENNQKIA
jgi:hypothetical protein